MNAAKELPLCRECESLKERMLEAQEEAQDLERQQCEAENEWMRLRKKLEEHESEQHGEDDPWLLYQLAEKMGQLNFLKENAA